MRTRGTSGTTVPSSTALPGYVHVQRDFGARGDGTTDDTAAINAAIAAVTPLRGNVLVLEQPKEFYLAPNGITESNTGMTVMGVGGHVGLGPGSQEVGMGVVIKATATGAWTWRKDSAESGAIDYRGGRFQNITFAGDADTAGGLRIETCNCIVERCYAMYHTTGIGFAVELPSTGIQAALNRFLHCSTKDCLYGYQNAAGATYTHWIDCMAQLFTQGGILHTGAGIRNYGEGSMVFGGHFEGMAIGIQCLQDLDIKIFAPKFENCSDTEIDLARASGTSGTRNLVIVSGDTEVRVGAYQVEDTIIGGYLADSGTKTVHVSANGGVNFQVPSISGTGAPAAANPGALAVKDGKLYYHTASGWLGLTGT